MPYIRIDTEGFDKQVHRLEGFAAQMADLRGFWPVLVPVFIRWMREQFATEGAWGGQRWARLSPAYAAAKAVRHPGKGILIAEGDLRQAASRPKRTVTPSSLTLEIVDPKIEFHQDGTDRMPARPVVPSLLPAVAVQEVNELAEIYVTEALSRWGLLP